ncbi:hypothetical protein GCM10023231_21890 [Olivibacter ginsenosidimutans]|uniref:Tetratricopeptide repeat protein n=1 Tax=Olivibacter ginsenosidimutans TaxID=1176537 RepID=A0ABP9BF38_9SPHI
MNIQRIYIVIIITFLRVSLGHAQDGKPDQEMLINLYQSQQYAQAAAYLENFYQENTDDVRLLQGLAYCNRMAGNYVNAEKYYKALLAIREDDLSVLSSLAAINYQRGQLKQSSEYYNRILTLDSTHLASYKALASIAQQAGDMDKVYQYLSTANRLAPKDMDVVYDLSNFYITLERYQPADSILTKALTYDPENVILLGVKAQATFGLQQYSNTVTIGEQLLDLGIQSADLLNLLGQAYYHDNQYDKCIDMLQQLEEKGGLKEAQLYYIAMSYKKLSQNKEAIHYFDKTLKAAISPNVANYYFEKADLYEKTGQNISAATAYIKSLQFQVMPITYYSLGILYDHKLKRTKTAIQYYQRYLKMKPSKDNAPYLKYVKQRLEELK